MDKIKVLIVDDSASVRQMLTEIISSDQALEVVGTAADPYGAVRRIEELAPDIIVLDIEMPRMDGLTFLEKLMKQHPMPVVMCSSITIAGSQAALQALEMGAVDIIEKPRVDTLRHLSEARTTICDVLRSAASTRKKSPLGPRSEQPKIPAQNTIPPKLSPDVILPGPVGTPRLPDTENIVVVGASTGGTEALRVLLAGLPGDCPGILVVQHMPERFTNTFAQRLDTLCEMQVREAAQGDIVRPGLALIAPGNRHMLLKRTGGQYHVDLHDGPLVSRHRPAVNVLFRSAARYAGHNALGIILTGMGDDGALGLLELRQQGAHTVAQDEASCIVYGMPGEAVRLGAVQRILPLDEIATEILRHCRKTP